MMCLFVSELFWKLLLRNVVVSVLSEWDWAFDRGMEDCCSIKRVEIIDF